MMIDLEKDVRLCKEIMIKNILNRGQTPVRIAVYNSNMNRLGYKVDSEWTLHENLFKAHPLEKGGLPPHLIRNLLFYLNTHTGMVAPFNAQERWDTKDTSFNLVVEQVDSRGNLVKRLINYKVYQDEKGKYKSEGPIIN